jgi:arginyl-tRNA synthetase
LSIKGVLPPPKGAIAEDWEDREQTLFRSTEVRRRYRSPAAEVGWIGYTYFAADVAYFKTSSTAASTR